MTVRIRQGLGPAFLVLLPFAWACTTAAGSALADEQALDQQPQGQQVKPLLEQVRKPLRLNLQGLRLVHPQGLRLVQPQVQVVNDGPISVIQPTPGPVAPTLTLELKDVTLREAAAALAKATGLTLTVPPAISSPGGVITVTDAGLLAFDEARKASFNWKDTPVSDALRDYCRAFACSLTRDYRGGLGVSPFPSPVGPVAKVPGFALGVGRITFSDYRTSGDEVADPAPRRSLGLQLQIRAEGVDPATLLGLENVRVLDQDSRDVLDVQTQVAAGGAGGRTQPTAFPDERSQSFSFDWPYPAPRRLKRIEGDLIVARSIKRGQLEMVIPPPSELTIIQAGDAQIQFVQVNNNLSNFQLSLQVVQPPTLDLQASNGSSAVRLLLEDGTTVPATASINYWNAQDGWTSGYASVNAQNLKSKPVKLIWSVVTKSEQMRRYHFRLDNYPAILDESPAPKTPAPVLKPKPLSKGAAQPPAIPSASPAPRKTAAPIPARGRNS